MSSVIQQLFGVVRVSRTLMQYGRIPELTRCFKIKVRFFHHTKSHCGDSTNTRSSMRKGIMLSGQVTSILLEIQETIDEIYQCTIFKRVNDFTWLIDADWRTYAAVQHTNFASDNSWSPVRRQAIIWTRAVILSIRLHGKYFSDISIKNPYIFIQENAFKRDWKMATICLGLNVLMMTSPYRNIFHVTGPLSYRIRNLWQVSPHFHGISWWRHQMETFTALLALCSGNLPFSPVNFPHKRPVTRSFDVFFEFRLNKRLSKQSIRGDLRRHHAHYDVNVMTPG